MATAGINLTQALYADGNDAQALVRCDTALRTSRLGDPVRCPGVVAGPGFLVMWVRNDQHQASPIPDTGRQHASCRRPRRHRTRLSEE